MFSSFADHRKPRFRHEQATYPEHLQYRVLTADGRVFNSGNPQGTPLRYPTRRQTNVAEVITPE